MPIEFPVFIYNAMSFVLLAPSCFITEKRDGIIKKENAISNFNILIMSGKNGEREIRSDENFS